VLRLVGLYHCQRGAHTYFLKVKDVPRPGAYVVNLIHYEDAARLSMSVRLRAALLGGAAACRAPDAGCWMPACQATAW
jgi:hypothetical protein